MRNILLAVSGLNPQVITEALYALLMEGRFVDEIHIVTTRDGKNQILRLLEPGGPFNMFLKEYGIKTEKIDFRLDNVHAVCDEHDIEIDDILDDSGNESFLKKCLELTHRFTSTPETAVFFLIAGGRKTMSSCLTLAAQLYGRPQDRIYHVLVSPEFEACRDFWYPPKKSVSITLHDSKGNPYQKETMYASIQLLSIPFISVRDRIKADMLDKPRSPSELMSSLIRDEPLILNVKLAEGKIIYGKMELDLHPAQLALYAWFAERKKNCNRERTCRNCTECFVESGVVLEDRENLIRLYQAIPGSRVVEEMSDTGIVGLNRENFNSYKSKIKKDIKNRFGSSIASEIGITPVGSRPDTRYGIRLDKSRICIER